MKKLTLIILLIFLITSPIFAFIPTVVHDQLSWLQDLEEYVKEAERYVQTAKKWEKEAQDYAKKYKALSSGDFQSVISTLRETTNKINSHFKGIKGSRKQLKKTVKDINNFKDNINNKESSEAISEAENIIDDIENNIDEINTNINDLKVADTQERLSKVTSAVQENMQLATSESIQEQLGAIIKQLSLQTELMLEYNQKLETEKEYEKTLSDFIKQKEEIEKIKEMVETQEAIINKNQELYEEIDSNF